MAFAQPKSSEPAAGRSGHAHARRSGERLGAEGHGRAAQSPAHGVPRFLQRATADASAEAAVPSIYEEEEVPAVVQPKLTVSTPGDPFEEEADAVADRVMRMPAAPDSAVEEEELPVGNASGAIQRKCAGCGGTHATGGEMCPECAAAAGDQIHRKANAPGGAPAAGASVSKVVASPGAGSPLAPALRARIEPVVGGDLSGVRTHAGGEAASAAAAINAKAFTHGQHIWLGGGQSADDAELVAHEATHTVQQAGGAGDADTSTVSSQSSKASLVTTGAPANTVSRYGPDDFAPDADARIERELQSLGALGPHARDTIQGEMSASSTLDEMAGKGSEHFQKSISASGVEGSIDTTTDIWLNIDLDDPTTTVLHPTHRSRFDPELGFGMPEDVPAYPVTLSYTRRITYTDKDGREVTCDIHGSTWFSIDTWIDRTQGIDINIDTLPDILGDDGLGDVELSGSGPVQSYFAGFAVSGNSLAVQSEQAEWELQYGGVLPINSHVTPTFQRTDATAGAQFSNMYDFLASADVIELARRLEMERRRRENEPGLLEEIGFAIADFLSDVAEAVGDFWDALPPEFRGILKALGKAGLVIAAVVAVAALIVGGAEVILGVTLVFSEVMLVLGALLLVGAWGVSTYSRIAEAIDEERYGLIPIAPLLAVLDAVGFSGFVEALTDRSILTGRPLGPEGRGRSTEERWEAGTAGVIQMLMVILGVRSALRARGGISTEAPPETPLETPPPTETPSETPLPAETPEPFGETEAPRIGETERTSPLEEGVRFDDKGRPILEVSESNIEMTEPTYDGHAWNFELYDSESGGVFCWVEAEAPDATTPPANGPHTTLTPEEAFAPDGEVHLNARGFRWTRAMLDRVIAWYEGKFGVKPPNMSGYIAWRNETRFQWAWASLRNADPGLTETELASQAARATSFGRHRADVGYGELSATWRYMGDTIDPETGEVKVFEGVRLDDVPQGITIHALPDGAGPSRP